MMIESIVLMIRCVFVRGCERLLRELVVGRRSPAGASMYDTLLYFQFLLYEFRFVTAVDPFQFFGLFLSQFTLQVVDGRVPLSEPFFEPVHLFPVVFGGQVIQGGFFTSCLRLAVSQEVNQIFQRFHSSQGTDEGDDIRCFHDVGGLRIGTDDTDVTALAV